jgi:hypothetical protein
MAGMDETSLHALLDSAIGDEPPIGPVARNSLRKGIKLRRSARYGAPRGPRAVVAAVAVCIPIVNGVVGVEGRAVPLLGQEGLRRAAAAFVSLHAATR